MVTPAHAPVVAPLFHAAEPRARLRGNGGFLEEFAVRLALYVLLLALPLSLALGACEETSLFGEVRLVADTVTVGTPTGPSGLPSAIDIAREAGIEPLLSRPETLTDAGRWDFAVRQASAGAPVVLRAFRPVQGTGAAGIAPSSRDFDQVDEAPRGGGYQSEPVTLVQGATYLLRSRRYSACVSYGKAKVLALDAAQGTATLALVVNENCDDERLAD